MEQQFRLASDRKKFLERTASLQLWGGTTSNNSIYATTIKLNPCSEKHVIEKFGEERKKGRLAHDIPSIFLPIAVVILTFSCVQKTQVAQAMEGNRTRHLVITKREIYRLAISQSST